MDEAGSSGSPPSGAPEERPPTLLRAAPYACQGPVYSRLRHAAPAPYAPRPFSSESVAQYHNFLRLRYLFPELNPSALHSLLEMCHGNFTRAVDNVIYMKRVKNNLLERLALDTYRSRFSMYPYEALFSAAPAPPAPAPPPAPYVRLPLPPYRANPMAMAYGGGGGGGGGVSAGDMSAGQRSHQDCSLFTPPPHEVSGPTPAYNPSPAPPQPGPSLVYSQWRRRLTYSAEAQPDSCDGMAVAEPTGFPAGRPSPSLLEPHVSAQPSAGAARVVGRAVGGGKGDDMAGVAADQDWEAASPLDYCLVIDTDSEAAHIKQEDAHASPAR